MTNGAVHAPQSRYGEVDPIARFPQFYDNPAIRELGRHRLWTVSDNDKRPVDIVAALDTSMVCVRCGRSNCSTVHGAQLSEASSQLLTLPELTRRLPDAANAAVHLDWQLDGLVVLDIEPGCPPEVTNQLLRLATGNTAEPDPPALYSEVSGSGRGYHLLLPPPASMGSIPNISGRVKLRHPQGWFEVLLHHWITFSRRPIPPQRLEAARDDLNGEMLTWNGLFAQLAAVAPGNGMTAVATVGDAAALRARGEPLDTTEQEIVDEMIRRHRLNYSKALREDFGGDTSRWEFSQLCLLAENAQTLFECRRAAHASLHRQPVVDDGHTDETLLRLTHRAALSVLPRRDKHDQPRGALDYLTRECVKAVGNLHLQ